MQQFIDSTPESRPLAYSLSGAARALDVSKRQIQREISAGRLPARKLGRRTLVQAADLLSLLANLPAADRAAS